MNSFLQKYEYYKEIIETELEKNLVVKQPETIYNAVRYSTLNSGKRIRPILMLAALEAVGKDYKKAIPFAISLEMIHCYSLIHDDLPCMDNDDYRRGKLTNHKVFGEAVAVLAGDALLNQAFYIMSNECLNNFDFTKLIVMKNISLASGIEGMIKGQVLDIYSEGKDLSIDEIMLIHGNKTGKIIENALTSGVILGEASENILKQTIDIGKKLGFAFQIKDDILDIISTKETLGKNINSDIKNKKSTYASILGLERATNDYKLLTNEILEKTKDVFGKNIFLYSLLEKIIEREN